MPSSTLTWHACYVRTAELMLRKRFNISRPEMKNASLWTISAWLELDEKAMPERSEVKEEAEIFIEYEQK